MAEMHCPESAASYGHCRTFEPLLAGDRQREKRVAKKHNPLPSVFPEVSLS